MKVAIITRHAIVNYGSLLQAMATQHVIEEIGCSCDFIRYERADEHYARIEFTLLKSKTEWNQNKFKRLCYLALRQPESIIAGRKFEIMREQYLHLTRRYQSLQELQECKPVADIYLTGSDQVWGTVADGSIDGSYFLVFAEDATIKLAYAASFGVTENTLEAKAQLKKWLSSYDAITVRENSAVELLNNMGLCAEQVLDPTMLLTKEDWNRYVNSVSKPPKFSYVLVYQIHNDPALTAYAKEFAREVNLPLIRISAAFHQIIRGGKFKYLPDIGKFLGYIQYASYMITDSFHGTAFAINFNTQFLEILPRNKTKSRIQSILQLTGLTDRIITNMQDFSVKDNSINYESVNLILREERLRSKTVFQRLLTCTKNSSVLENKRYSQAENNACAHCGRNGYAENTDCNVFSL